VKKGLYAEVPSCLERLEATERTDPARQDAIDSDLSGEKNRGHREILRGRCKANVVIAHIGRSASSHLFAAGNVFRMMTFALAFSP
jgi:hypothetical protein